MHHLRSAMSLGASFEPAHIAFLQLNACNIARYFITNNFTLPHALYFVITAVMPYRLLDSYIRNFFRQ